VPEIGDRTTVEGIELEVMAMERRSIVTVRFVMPGSDGGHIRAIDPPGT
jgi:hypothetical protein